VYTKNENNFKFYHHVKYFHICRWVWQLHAFDALYSQRHVLTQKLRISMIFLSMNKMCCHLQCTRLNLIAPWRCTKYSTYSLIILIVKHNGIFQKECSTHFNHTSVQTKIIRNWSISLEHKFLRQNLIRTKPIILFSTISRQPRNLQMFMSVLAANPMRALILYT